MLIVIIVILIGISIQLFVDRKRYRKIMQKYIEENREFNEKLRKYVTNVDALSSKIKKTQQVQITG